LAFVIVSAGHLTGSRLHTLRVLPLAVASCLAVVLLMAGCIGLGYRLAGHAAPPTGVPATDAERPEFRALVTRVGSLAGRLAQLEGQAAALAGRLGTAPRAAQLSLRDRPDSTGGPLVPVDDLARLEFDLSRLEGAMAELSDAATEQEVETMAYPNRMPVPGARVPVSSHYGTRRDPFTGRLARHTGLDIPARHGVPILASGGGRVVSAGYRGAYGQTVVIDHGEGLATLYGHASRLLVRPGDVVMPQQKIALVGSTGRSTGPHLHFEVIRDGLRIEPRQYLGQVLQRPAETRAR
jgi:murein DD-endopeptidase MepM/ murein hydrolase activator NlpD